MKGDHDEAKALQNKLQPLRDAYALGTFPGVIKEALRMFLYERTKRKPMILPIIMEI